MTNVKLPFRPIETPDDREQYRKALRAVSQSPTLPPPGGRLDLEQGRWLVVSIWVMSVYRTGDDLLMGDPGVLDSSIELDLSAWEDWLGRRGAYASQPNGAGSLQMVSVPLIESTAEYDQTLFNQHFRLGKFKSLEFVLGAFEVFQREVDKDFISSEMETSHQVWVYKDREPVCTVVHGDDGLGASKLAEVLEKIIY